MCFLLLQQYQSAIRSHKAGKTVNFDELPVPPGENPSGFTLLFWRLQLIQVTDFGLPQASLRSQVTNLQEPSRASSPLWKRPTN